MPSTMYIVRRLVKSIFQSSTIWGAGSFWLKKGLGWAVDRWGSFIGPFKYAGPTYCGAYYPLWPTSNRPKNCSPFALGPPYFRHLFGLKNSSTFLLGPAHFRTASGLKIKPIYIGPGIVLAYPFTTWTVWA